MKLTACVNVLRESEDSLTGASNLPNPVLVHSCFRATDPVLLFTDRDIMFHQNPNVRCDCLERVKYRERDDMLYHGEAYVITFKSALGSFIPEWREIVVVNRLPLPPVAQRITARNIQAAYGIGGAGIEFQCERIDEYGRLARFGGWSAWSAEVREKIPSVRRYGERLAQSLLVETDGVPDVADLMARPVGEKLAGTRGER